MFQVKGAEPFSLGKHSEAVGGKCRHRGCLLAIQPEMAVIYPPRCRMCRQQLVSLVQTDCHSCRARRQTSDGDRAADCRHSHADSTHPFLLPVRAEKSGCSCARASLWRRGELPDRRRREGGRHQVCASNTADPLRVTTAPSIRLQT